METKIVRNPSVDDLKLAAKILREGGIVAIPTETVYGLGANGLLKDAANKVYKAKGRPSDNPLIIHLSTASDASKYCYTNKIFESLAKKFMPGPITVIMPKRDIIPNEVTGGLDSVAIRVPSHPIAHEIIKLAGVPIAAPSANISGRPSCTTVDHVIEDMNGRIDMIVDGGNSDIGLESTIVSIDDDGLVMLRPGAVTREMLENEGFSVRLDKAVTQQLSNGERPLAPGMKYRHYAPNAQVILLDGNHTDIEKFMKTLSNDPECALLCFDQYLSLTDSTNAYSIGDISDIENEAKKLFDILRSFDCKENIKRIYAPLPSTDGIGLAIYNRLIKASGYTVIKV